MKLQFIIALSILLQNSNWAQNHNGEEPQKKKVKINILSLEEFLEQSEISMDVSNSWGDHSRGHHYSYNPQLFSTNPGNQEINSVNRSSQMISTNFYGPGSFLVLNLGRVSKNFPNNKTVEFIYDVDIKTSLAMEVPFFISHTNSNQVNSKGIRTYSLGFGIPNTGVTDNYKGGTPKTGIGLGISFGYRHTSNNISDYSSNDQFFISKYKQTTPYFTTETGENIYNYIRNNPNDFESTHTAYSLSDIIDKHSSSGVFELFFNTRRTFQNEDVLGWNFKFQVFQKKDFEYGTQWGDERVLEFQDTLPNGEIVTSRVSIHENVNYQTDLSHTYMGGDFRLKAYYLKDNKFHIFVEAMAGGEDISVKSAELNKHFVVNNRQVVLGLNYIIKPAQ